VVWGRYFTAGGPGVALLAEADLPPEQLSAFIEQGRIDQLLAFLPNQALMLALATEDAAPLLASVAAHQEAVQLGSWRQFLRNLDEQNLSHLTDGERRKVFEVFAPREDERIYGRGIRRGWAPMMATPQRLRMTLSLLFALPGAPLLVAGQEIGMGDDLRQDGRATVRLPMQWSAEPGGGFSSSRDGEAAKLVVDGPFGIERVNVADQDGDPDSLLSLVRHLIELWDEHPQVASPRTEDLKADTSVVAFRYEHIVAVHNLAAEERPVPELVLGAERLLGDELRDGRLAGHGFLWARLPD
jgi:maltose alpha-D-glucosyltransferase/alpha-amylase